MIYIPDGAGVYHRGQCEVQAQELHSHWEVIWVCATFMTHLFTPIYSSGDPQFQAQIGLKAAQ